VREDGGREDGGRSDGGVREEGGRRERGRREDEEQRPDLRKKSPEITFRKKTHQIPRTREKKKNKKL
jgi:hypothetical protein